MISGISSLPIHSAQSCAGCITLWLQSVLMVAPHNGINLFLREYIKKYFFNYISILRMKGTDYVFLNVFTIVLLLTGKWLCVMTQLIGKWSECFSFSNHLPATELAPQICYQWLVTENKIDHFSSVPGEGYLALRWILTDSLNEVSRTDSVGL